jgi:cell division protease FtsH
MQPVADSRDGEVEPHRADPRPGAAGDAVARYADDHSPPGSMRRDRRGWRVAPAPDGRGTPDEHKPRPPHRLRDFWIFFIVLLAVNWLSLLAFHPGTQPRVTVPFSPYFLTQLNEGHVKSISTQGYTVDGTFKTEMKYPATSARAAPTTLFATRVPSFWNNGALTTLLEDKGVQVNAKSTSSGTSLLADIILGFGPTLLLVGLFVLLARRAAAAGMGGEHGTSGAPRPDGSTRRRSR